MKQTVVREYEDSDFELLKKRLPENPCNSCGAGVGCCGCPKGREYEDKVKPYKDAGIFDVAERILEYYEKREEINGLVRECTDIIASIDEEIIKRVFDERELKSLEEMGSVALRGYAGSLPGTETMGVF